MIKNYSALNYFDRTLSLVAATNPLRKSAFIAARLRASHLRWSRAVLFLCVQCVPWAKFGFVSAAGKSNRGRLLYVLENQ